MHATTLSSTDSPAKAASTSSLARAVKAASKNCAHTSRGRRRTSSHILSHGAWGRRPRVASSHSALPAHGSPVLISALTAASTAASSEALPAAAMSARPSAPLSSAAHDSTHRTAAAAISSAGTAARREDTPAIISFHTATSASWSTRPPKIMLSLSSSSAVAKNAGGTPEAVCKKSSPAWDTQRCTMCASVLSTPARSSDGGTSFAPGSSLAASCARTHPVRPPK
mmetsp:Transcript_50754/g.162470  ORF Transcript_50754/g.162470 Transcript_50754/m.162470 type:complete len:226 (-) Transcript_50754:868-1545(-)